MKRKRAWIGIAALAAVILLCRAVYLGQMVPLIERDSESGIFRAEFFPYKWPRGEFVTERIDGDKVLELLEARQRKRGRSGKKSRIIMDNDTKFEIFGRDKYGEFEIFIGEWHIFCRSAGKTQRNYWILEDDGLLEEMLALIDE